MDASRRSFCAAGALLLGGAAAAELAPTGRLRAAINFGNPVLVRVPTSPVVVDEFIARKLDVAAGVRQQLEADAKRVGGVRVLPGRFMVIEQALGVPKGHAAAQAWLSTCIEELKATGFVAEALRRHRIEGAAVAPPRA